jgi:ketosteroid isomerase-like protein
VERTRQDGSTTGAPARSTRRLRRRRALRNPLWLVLVLAVSLPALAHISLTQIAMVTGGKHSEEMKQIEDLERQWQTAIMSNNTAVVSSLLGDSYIGIGPDGTIATKAEDLQSRASGQQQIANLDVEDRRIRIYGTTAVVTSKVKVRGMYSGQPLLGEYRYTRVWSLEQGRWQIVSFEANRVHDSAARRR